MNGAYCKNSFQNLLLSSLLKIAIYLTRGQQLHPL